VTLNSFILFTLTNSEIPRRPTKPHRSSDPPVSFQFNRLSNKLAAIHRSICHSIHTCCTELLCSLRNQEIRNSPFLIQLHHSRPPPVSLSFNRLSNKSVAIYRSTFHSIPSRCTQLLCSLHTHKIEKFCPPHHTTSPLPISISYSPNQSPF
jgi:hypothetical protein